MTGPMLDLNAILGPAAGDMHRQLGEALEARHTGLVASWSAERRTVLAVLLFEGIPGWWRAESPVGADQARRWVEDLQNSVGRAAESPELH
jgi:hypothetical protein